MSAPPPHDDPTLVEPAGRRVAYEDEVGPPPGPPAVVRPYPWWLWALIVLFLGLAVRRAREERPGHGDRLRGSAAGGGAEADREHGHRGRATAAVAGPEREQANGRLDEGEGDRRRAGSARGDEGREGHDGGRRRLERPGPGQGAVGAGHEHDRRRRDDHEGWA